MTMPSARWSLQVGVAGEDGVGEGGGGGVAEVLVDDGFDVVGGEDFEGGGEGGFGEGVGVFGEEEGAGGVLGGAVFDDGLGDGGDVVVVEGGGEGAAAVAGGAEGDALGGDGGVGMEGVVGGDEAGEVDRGLQEREGGRADWVWCVMPLCSSVGADDLCHYMGCGLRVEMDGGRG